MSIVLVTTSCVDNFEVDGIYYCKNADSMTVSVTSDSGNSYFGSVVIPSKVTYRGKTYSVSSIGDGAFEDSHRLSSITIPSSVTSIGDEAFYHCDGLKSATIPNSVISIGDYAFSGCSNLKSVIIPDSITSIGNDVFYGCSGLTTVSIGNSITSIGSSAFYGCKGLTSITIGNSVTEIGPAAFCNCTSLAKVEISDVAAWCKINFCDSAANPLVYAHYLYKNRTKIKNLVIPNSVTKIRDFAFKNCSGLTSVIISDSVTSIGKEAFAGCDAITDLTIGSSVKTIGPSAFDIARLGRINVLNSVPPTCYDNTVLKSVDKENCLLTIPHGTIDLYSTTYVWWDFKQMKPS